MNEISKVDYAQPLHLQFETTVTNQLSVSKAYLKELAQYNKDYKEWKKDLAVGDASELDEPTKPQISYDGLNQEMLAYELQNVLPTYASANVGLPIIYNHETRIFEMSQDDLESRLWNILYVKYMLQYTPHLAMDNKISNQFRNAVMKMAKNAKALGSDLPFNDKIDYNLIAFKNGTYRFKENTLTETKKEDYQTTRIEFDYIEDAKQNIVTDWIEYILEDNAKTLFQLIGRIFYRNQDPQAMVFATGEGSNGKSKVMEFIEHLVGSENVSHATIDSLSSKQDKFASSQLYGKMVNIETDMSATHIKQTGLLKTLSGNDVLSAEFKGMNKFTFTNYALMIFTTNNMPTFADSSHGFARRIITLPFNKQMSKSNETDAMWLERSKNFTYEEKSEFISYCVQQYRNVLYGLSGETKGVFFTTEQAQAERSAFLDTNDTVGNFIDLYNVKFTDDSSVYTLNSDTLRLYNDFLESEGLKAVSSRKLINELKRKAKSQNIILKTGVKRVNGVPVNVTYGMTIDEIEEEDLPF